MHLADERGGLDLGGLRGLVVTLVIAAVLLFEIGAIVTNYYQLDALSGRAAVAGAGAWQRTPAGDAVVRAVNAAVDGAASVERIEISRDEGAVTVSLRRAPAVLVLDRVPALRERLSPTVTQQASLDPAGL